MKPLIILSVLFLSLLVRLPAVGADYQKGLDAYNRKDYNTALKEWIPLAANRGDARAQAILGYMYVKGLGVSQNYKTAVKWYTLAAEQGNAAAEHNLGFMYHQGQGVPRNYKTAVKWYTLAAEKGIADAQHNLSTMYAAGLGVKVNWVYAHMWINLAASNGSMNATELREIAEKRMTSDQIAEAQRLAREWKAKHTKR